MLKRILLGLLVLGILALPLRAQFVSGSTGVDGAFNPTMSTALNCPANDCVFNYTTVNIPNGVTISYRPNAFNTPVTILAQGDVTIAGTITVSGSKGGAASAGATGGAGGPGGFRGGDGGRPGRDGSDVVGMMGGPGWGREAVRRA